jgi:SPX domain protein involved in polyphosphate accumulation
MSFVKQSHQRITCTIDLSNFDFYKFFAYVFNGNTSCDKGWMTLIKNITSIFVERSTVKENEKFRKSLFL